MINLGTEYCCRVCGYKYDTPTWENGIPSHDICICCACHMGPDDHTLERILAYRVEWLATGGQWRDKYVDPPPNWDREAQMKNIPPEFL